MEGVTKSLRETNSKLEAEVADLTRSSATGEHYFARTLKHSAA